MRLMNTNTASATAPALVQLQQPPSYPSNKACERYITQLDILLQSTSPAPYILTQADLLALLQDSYTAHTLKFGQQRQDAPDQAMSFDEVRLFCMAMTGKDVLVGSIYDANPVAQIPMAELRSYSAAQPAPMTVAANSSLLVTVQIPRPFIYDNFGIRSDIWCPGTSQMRQIQHSFRINTAFSTNGGLLKKAGTIAVSYLTDDIEWPYDSWVNVIRMAPTNAASLELTGPGGVLLGLAEVTVVGAATALGIFSLKPEGREFLVDMMMAKAIVNSEIYKMDDADGLNLQSYATWLFHPRKNCSLDQLPIADSYLFRAAKQDLATFQLRWFYVPQMTESYRDETVRPNINHGEAGGLGKKVFAASEFVVSGEKIPTSYSTVAPLVFLTPEHPQAGLDPAAFWDQGKPTMAHVPPHIKAATEAAVKALPGNMAQIVAAKVAQVSAAIPGSTSASGKVTARQLELAHHIAPAQTSLLGGNLQQALSSLLKLR